MGRDQAEPVEDLKKPRRKGLAAIRTDLQGLVLDRTAMGADLMLVVDAFNRHPGLMLAALPGIPPSHQFPTDPDFVEPQGARQAGKDLDPIDFWVVIGLSHGSTPVPLKRIRDR